MITNTAQVTTIGDRLKVLYRKTNYNEDYFAELAEAALTENQFDYCWNACSLLEYDFSRGLTHNLNFSDTSLTLYSNPYFYIELLHWMSGSTDIHQHGFNGAFKVVNGASIHCEYEFCLLEKINDDALLGNVNCVKVEKLTTGDVRQIHSDLKGAHCLFHLAQPSATLVIRTYGHAANAPQYSLLPPKFALNRFGLEADRQVKVIMQLLTAVRQVSYTEFVEIIMQSVQYLDFSRLAKVVFEVSKHGLVQDQKGSSNEVKRLSDLDQLFAHALRYHPKHYVEALKQVVSVAKTKKSLARFRKVSDDPELRYFIALLMNVSNRQDLFNMVKEEYPQYKPVDKVADWLFLLSQQKVALAKKLFEFSSQAGVMEFRLGNQLSAVLPSNVVKNEAASREFFKQALTLGAGYPSQPLAWQANMTPEENPSDLDGSISQLKRIQEIGVLFEA